MDLIINSMMVWLALLIIFIGIEIATMGLTTIWFAGGALVAILATVLNAPLVIQIVLFVLVSLLLLFFTRPVAVKYFNRDRVRTNVESMVGRQGIVTGEVDNLKATGQVTVSGQEWSARCCDDRVKIPVGTVVKILAINGVKLIVVPEMQTQNQQRTRQPEAGMQPEAVVGDAAGVTQAAKREDVKESAGSPMEAVLESAGSPQAEVLKSVDSPQAAALESAGSPQAAVPESAGSPLEAGPESANIQDKADSL